MPQSLRHSLRTPMNCAGRSVAIWSAAGRNHGLEAFVAVKLRSLCWQHRFEEVSIGYPSRVRLKVPTFDLRLMLSAALRMGCLCSSALWRGASPEL